ncbi:MAG TPA: hypothetical protein DHV28_00730 [Ignavibacteriales bacterium]|nr:hypothetical protein [Ignavibacteriales bacterium]
MKSNLILNLIIVFGIVIAGCQPSEKSEIDIINDEFSESQAEIKEVLDGIFKSIQDKDDDKLISYHIYGPKFTEFRDGEPRTGSEANEKYERGLVSAVSKFDYELGDLAINVFGEVAVVTFHADFRPTIGEDVNQILGQVTLVFVKTDNAWKITHEHFSPLNSENKG